MPWQRQVRGNDLRLNERRSDGSYAVLAAIVCLAFHPASVSAQSAEDAAIRFHNTVTAGLAISKTFAGDDPRTSEVGFDYLYRFKPRWEVGVQVDFVFEKSFGEREARIIVPIAAYSITDRIPLFFGVGVEHRRATDENEPVVRLGSEYTIFLDKQERLLLLPGGFLDWVDGNLSFSAVLALGNLF